MKKYIWLVSVTGLVIAMVFGAGKVFAKKPMAVSVVTINEQTVRQTVKCNGKVQAGDSREVFLETPCVAGTVYVKEGDRVKKGQRLFAVDKEATQAVLSQWTNDVADSVLEEVLAKEVVAPIDGVVTALNVRAGETTDYTVPCAVIASGNVRQIAVSVKEQFLPLVQEGQSVAVTGVAFSKTYHGTLRNIATSARQQYTGTVAETVVDAVVSLDEGSADSALRVGLNAQAEIIVDTVEKALLLPYETVGQSENGEEFVYVYDGRETVRRRAVVLGRETADGILVVSGISAGERVVQEPEGLSGKQITVRVVQ
ncbi:MAG: efflux RND transporter periplasmic adaptor subunit [Clostridia bacterium]|nr:efflux RND transporter periplasmic adaptor subunit [Clostridia bacterium]